MTLCPKKAYIGIGRCLYTHKLMPILLPRLSGTPSIRRRGISRAGTAVPWPEVIQQLSFKYNVQCTMYNGGGVSFPVRGCISVARDGCAREPNPREGIHGSPRIARIARISEKRICGDMRGLRAIWFTVVHRWFLTGRRYENLGIGLAFGNLVSGFIVPSVQIGGS